MRFRSTVAPAAYASGSYSVKTDTGEVHPGQAPWASVAIPSASRIWDDPSPRWFTYRGQRTPLYKNTTHIKYSGDFSGSVLSYHYPGSPGGTVTGLDTRYWTTGLSVNGRKSVSDMALLTVSNHIATVVPGKMDVFAGHYDRWSAIRPTMRTKANMAVFLGELTDIRRMWDVLPRRSLKKRNWKEALAWGNGLHLNYNFGWKPFQRDLYNFADAVASFDERLKKFVKNESVFQTLRRGDKDYEGGYSWDDYIDGYWKRTYKSLLNIQRRSTFQCVYDIPDYSPQELRIRSWADSFGLHVSPANIWALMPWSFVVDWFVDVSGFLGQFDSDYTSPNTTILQACTSLKIKCVIECQVSGPSAWGSPRGLLYTVGYDFFSRASGAPSFNWDSPLPLSTDKIRLLASLVAGRVL